jgi:hypothetical protein
MYRVADENSGVKIFCVSVPLRDGSVFFQCLHICRIGKASQMAEYLLYHIPVYGLALGQHVQLVKLLEDPAEG